MHLLPHDYFSDRPAPRFGLAATAALIHEARANAANTILLDNGDFLNGNPMADMALRLAAETRHPIVEVMAGLEYDAITLGNHDFDEGVERLAEVLAQMPFPVVTSNLQQRPDGAGGEMRPMPGTALYTILERTVADRDGAHHSLRIGVIGFMPPGSVLGRCTGNLRTELRDIVETARDLVPRVRAAGADLVIALAHSGIAGAVHDPGMENAVVPLARVPGIDAIVSGHAHQVFPGEGQNWAAGVDVALGRIHGVPVVAPGFWGSHLGVIDLVLGRDGHGRWQVQEAKIEARPVARCVPETGRFEPLVEPDTGIVAMLEELHEVTRAELRRPAGNTRQRLHGYFAAIAPAPALDVVHRAMAWHCAHQIGRTELAGLPLVASTASFKAGGPAGPGFFTDIPAGPVARSAISDLYPFPNGFVALRVTGAELADWLERAVSAYTRLVPGQGDQPLLEPDAAPYMIETVAGVGYVIDLAVPARYDPQGQLADAKARRIRDLTLAGAPLDPQSELLLLANSYRLQGGGAYPLPGPGRIAVESSICVAGIVGDYLAETGHVAQAPWARWRFASVPGASATFLTAPRAREVAGDLDGLDLTHLGETSEGFARYRLTL